MRFMWRNFLREPWSRSPEWLGRPPTGSRARTGNSSSDVAPDGHDAVDVESAKEIEELLWDFLNVRDARKPSNVRGTTSLYNQGDISPPESATSLLTDTHPPVLR